jgi:hypothetical protein
MSSEKSQVIPPPPEYKYQTVREYAMKYNLHTLIETGTYLGEMIEATKDCFTKIVSIELAQKLYERAITKFRESSHIQLYLGDSAKVLPEILSGINEPCLFWLDAHYSGGITTKGDRVTPIMEELNIILGRKQQDDILLIDDARGFTGSNDYPTVDEVICLVKKYDSVYLIENINDIIRVFK